MHHAARPRARARRAERLHGGALGAGLALAPDTSPRATLAPSPGELVGRDTVLKGALEASVKAASGPGLITAVLMIVPGAGESAGWQELAFEFFGKASLNPGPSSDRLSTSAHPNLPFPSPPLQENGKIQTQAIVPGSPEEDPTAGHLPRKQIPIETSIGDTFNDYHNVRIEWGADALRWLVDGKAIREESTSDPTYAKFSAGQVEPMSAWRRLEIWSLQHVKVCASCPAALAIQPPPPPAAQTSASRSGRASPTGPARSTPPRSPPPRTSSTSSSRRRAGRSSSGTSSNSSITNVGRRGHACAAAPCPSSAAAALNPGPRAPSQLADWSFPFSVSNFSPSNVQAKSGELVISFTR
jgi:hypothetical protein